MPRGPKTNWDAKVKRLFGELRAALVQREKARLEATVDAMVAGIGHGLATAKQLVDTAAAKVAGAVTGRIAKRKKVGRRSVSAGRARQIAAMKAYWAAKRKGQGAATRAPRAKPAARPKPAGAWAAMTREQRAERIARMQAGRRAGGSLTGSEIVG